MSTRTSRPEATEPASEVAGAAPVPRRARRGRRLLAVGASALLVAGLAVACTSDDDPSGNATDPDEVSCTPEDLPAAVTADQVAAADTDGTTIKLVTHDSFALSDGVLDRFTDETGITVEVVQVDDAGTLVSQAVLSAGNPVADVLFGIDNTFLCRGTSRGVFVPYRAAALDDVPADLRLAEADLATPIDVGDVCLNYSKAAFPGGAGAPEGLDDLTKPELADAFVTENPETSSPGMAFLLATIATYGEDGWEQYWKDLRANGLLVTAGWTEAYEDAFGAGSGERSVVTSYASSPVADVLYSDPPRDEPNLGVVADACFRQVEFAGILRGTKHPEAAAKLVDFLLSPTVQEDLPLTMFVSPANETAEVPATYAAHTTPVEHPITMSPAEIEAGRDRWTEAWTQIALR